MRIQDGPFGESVEPVGNMRKTRLKKGARRTPRSHVDSNATRG
jgi:hypothetical protein